MIDTYDDKEEATYNIKGLGKYLENCLEYQEQQKRKAIAEAESYYRGYSDAVRNIVGIMEASNYRVSGGDE